MVNGVGLIPRELIAFAFVEDEYSRTGDIARGLMPLFNPILGRKPNQIFDPEWFAKEVESAYDIPMSTIVAEGLVSQLANIGQLYLDKSTNHTYRISAHREVNTPLEGQEFDDLIGEFVKFCMQRLEESEFKIDQTVLESALLKRFTSLQFLSLLKRQDKNYYKGNTLTLRTEKEPEETIDLEQQLDVLCADFALLMLETNSSKFDLLIKIASGALIAEVVLTLQRPSPDEKMSEVTLLLDGPLILDFLNLSTIELRDFSKDLFDLLNKSQLKKAVLRHTLDEMKGTINGPLEALQRGEVPFGPLGDRIKNGSQQAAYARAIHDELEETLRKLDIEIIDSDDFETDAHLEFCTKEMEESIRNSLGRPHENLERRMRDAKSVATILRMRGKKSLHPQSITEANYLLVTRNDGVAKHTRKHLIYKKQIDDRDFPPTLTDRQLAGLLWFSVGGNLAALSSKKLIANCSFVMHPRIDIISKLRQCLTDIDEDKAEIFTTLMRDQRAQRCLVQRTFGFPSVITASNAEELLEALRQSTADAVLREAQARELELKAEQEEKMQNIKSVYADSIIEKESELLTLITEHKTLKKEFDAQNINLIKEISDLKSSSNQVLMAYEHDIDTRMNSASALASDQYSKLKLLCIAVYIFIFIINFSFVQANFAMQLALNLFLTFISFWVVPDKIFKPLGKMIWSFYFFDEVKKFNLESKLSNYDVDTTMRKVIKKIN